MAGNSLDQFSKPKEEQKTELTTVFLLNPRDSKKGRLFIPVYDERFPLRFRTRYAYLSKFLEKDNAAGNHYHRVKQEVIIPVQGEFEIYLEAIQTGRKEMIAIKAGENKAVYIKTGVAHKIVSKQDTGVLLVLASNPSALEDEVKFAVN